MKNYLIKSKALLVVSLLFTIISAIMGVFIAFILSGIVNAAVTNSWSLLYRYIRYAAVYLILVIILGFISNYFQALYIKNTTKTLRKDVFQGIMSRDYKLFSTKQIGEYISILTNDVDAIESSYIESIFSILGSIVTIVISIISLIYINYKIIIGSVVVGILYISITTLFSNKLSILKNEWFRSLEKYTIRIKELLSGYEVIHNFDLQDKSMSSFGSVNEDMGEKKKRFGVKIDNINLFNIALGQGLIIIIIFICSYLVISKELKVGELVAVAQLMTNIITPLGALAASFNDIKSSNNIKENVLELIKESKLHSDKETKEESKEVPTFEVAIEVKNLRFSYDNKNIIDDLSMTFIKNKKYAIIGESGSGKSTLCKLLLNYYDDYTGTIEIDGIDYKTIRKKSFTKMVAVTQQNIFLFDGSIRDNITLFESYNEEQLSKVIQLSGLKKCIEKTNKTIDTCITENGSNLSGGEKQRIAIARALLRKTPILVFDEVTSALDQETSSEILENVLTLPDVTCIVVTHKLGQENVALYDEIIHMPTVSINVDNHWIL